MAIVLVIDTALGDQAVLAELLEAGPLIATTGATARHTAAVALLALVISVPAGIVSDAFGSGPHVTGIIVVAVGGAVSVVIAHLRTQRERNEARLAVQYGVARALAESDTFDDAAPRLLEEIARPLSRELAQFWTMHDDEKLRRVAVWRDPDVNFEEFERASGELSLVTGMGLPGTVWERRSFELSGGGCNPVPEPMPASPRLIAGLSSSASAGPIGCTSGRCALDFGVLEGFLGVSGFFAMARIWDESRRHKRVKNLLEMCRRSSSHDVHIGCVALSADVSTRRRGTVVPRSPGRYA